MGRKSAAQRLLDELPRRDNHDVTLLVLYDFRGGPPHPGFYANLRRITELTGDDSSLVQYSAYKTTSLRAALAAHALASRMGAETVVFEAAERLPTDLRRRLMESQAEAETPTHEAVLGPSVWSPAPYPRLTSFKYPPA